MRAIAFALMLAGAVALAGSQPARAQGPQTPSATIQFTMIKASYIIGGRGGEGVLQFQGRSYPISIGGLSIGLSIGGSASDIVGEVYNLQSPYDIEGIYAATQAGYALAGGETGMTLENRRGVLLHLRGNQIGFELSLDVSGMAISLQ